MRADPKAYQESLTARLAIMLGVRGSRGGYEFPSEAGLVTVALTLVEDSNPRVRASLPVLLVRSDPSPEVQAVVRQLLDDRDPAVRRAAAAVCRFCQPSMVIAPVAERLTEMLDDADSECRLEAAVQVCRLTNGQSLRAETVLRAALEDSRHLYRLTAMYVLCHHGKQMPGTLPAVRDHILNDSAYTVRSVGSAEVHAFGRPAVPLLMQLLEDPLQRVRSNACRGLGKLGSAARDALPDLRLRLDDADEETRSAAAAALRLIDPDQQPLAEKRER